MEDLELIAIRARVLSRGPDRVLVRTLPTMEPFYVPPWQAKRKYHVEPDMVYIRSDGWTVGATNADAPEIYWLYAGEWEAAIDLNETGDHGLPRIQRTLL